MYKLSGAINEMYFELMKSASKQFTVTTMFLEVHNTNKSFRASDCRRPPKPKSKCHFGL